MRHPHVTSLQDLTIIEVCDSEANTGILRPVIKEQEGHNSRRLGDSSAFIKRPGLYCYETKKGSSYIPKALLGETLVMEQISNSPHPNIVAYYSCRVKRGRITAILLERLEQTLTQYVSTPNFQQLDKVKFIGALESAVDYFHSLGLAHNDINPDNIMVKDGIPMLIDFGSSQPFGKRLQSLGTEVWHEEVFFTFEKKNDTYSFRKLREWLQKPS
ncbi:Protein kinase-like domain containing protein [Hyaloscypha variabilis]